MPFVVVYDASVLYPNTLRDLLIRLAQTGLVQARWTEQIVDEVFAALQRNRPDLDPARRDRTRTLMSMAVRDWRITEYEALIDSLKLPDPDDRHVLAAAIRAAAQVIVTANMRDFPAVDLQPWGIEAKTPDQFVRDQISLNHSVVYAVVRQIADSWRNPPGSIDDVLDRLERNGLPVSAAELRTGR